MKKIRYSPYSCPRGRKYISLCLFHVFTFHIPLFLSIHLTFTVTKTFNLSSGGPTQSDGCKLCIPPGSSLCGGQEMEVDIQSLKRCISFLEDS
ncbi:UNVERIFIED_CONTAM: hypothetical protein RMT77_006955 [Armadillidium vulgare]